MKKDMFDIFVDPPKTGGGYANSFSHTRAAKHFKVDSDLEVDDEFTTHAKKARKGRDKHSRENWGVLRRFLERRVGKPWNDIYSEVCENDKTFTAHRLRDQIKYYVSINVVFGPNGELFEYDSHGVWPVTTPWGRGNTLYVHPDTGILCRIPKEKRQHNRNALFSIDSNEKRKFGKFTYFELEVTKTEPSKKHFAFGTTKAWIRYDYIPANPKDIYRVYNKDRTAFTETYTYPTHDIDGGLYRLISKSASKKDIRDFGLNEPAKPA